ncbi:glycine zipper 2TM domain-containing protein [Methylotenera sp.]|uniref:glycine zipper 2TM domain-containing protein n=1 Tax=Methylotenera sp. TaxID=2051956 RepID=UPI0027178D97|nr:glycine zipper 2TM domain-containing protein [Methylotenera sp.]MDO9205300.1 glycine zipper 2TM domain-containing protein [Methylotenera sp.]MDP1522140.1 glycine zipper 2TM domain-containing protein [Methylotenera sp.]MDP3307243.1 glycine zipper 2TM domain-containing protein [Methylotenera sp.]MDP3818893.1 glycine zipper 2TM domain-containing protein [Methylotenera sp.]MDZ4211655.1 glycine zipper 2TM domain-containing protein [Methylotenera sp.]
MNGLKLNITKSVRVKMLVPALLTAIFAAPAMATDQYTDTARVLSATPQMERVNVPRQECRTEYQQQSYSNGGNNNVAGALIGGIAGGLLGSTIGKGNGRVAAAAVGAGVGAMTGNSIANNQRNYGSTRTVPVQSCYQVDSWQTVNTGYLVTYEYNGRTYTTVTNDQPGRYIDVSVAIEPRSRIVSQITYIEPARYSYNNRGWEGKHRRHNRDDRGGWDNRRGGDDRYEEHRGDRRYY